MSHSKKKILIAEDDDAILELVTIRLELAGFHTIAARTGLQALAHLRNAAPDAMVLDIGLPQMDGFEILSAMRGMSRFIPVLMLTARHTASDVQRAVALGATDFLAKPFDDKVLIERVTRMLHPTRAQTWAI